MSGNRPAGTDIGVFGRLLGHPLGLTLFFAQFVLLALVLARGADRRSSEGCLFCHEDRARMEEMGYPQFTVTAEEVERESRMPRTTCRDCHLGDGGSRDLEKAHRGLLRPFIVGRDGEVVSREGIMSRLVSSREDPLRKILPAVERGGRRRTDPKVLTVMYHDRNVRTFGYDPEVSRKTCGRPDCHPDEVEQFDATVMGSNYRQRSARVWNDVRGPNNCGPSFADVAPDRPAEENSFSHDNTARIAADLNVEFSPGMAEDKQQVCNLCHTGCLDCHYTPSPEAGTHSFSRRPPSSNCAGGGRGTMLCHGGALERRRGDNYLGGGYTTPAGMEGDAHLTLGMECIDCHSRGREGMGDMKRKAGCRDCHLEAEEALAASVHGKMTCASCHVRRLGGYQHTTWGPGKIFKRPNPFKKYSLYYGILEPPLLMRDQEGTWTAYKVWGNSVGNIREAVEPSTGVVFRWPDGETRDAYALLGTFPTTSRRETVTSPGFSSIRRPTLSVLPVNATAATADPPRDLFPPGDMSIHRGRGPSRGVTPLSPTVKDSESGKWSSMGRSKSGEGAQLSDFAAWTFIGERWSTAGDFAVPPDQPEKLEEFRLRYHRAEERLAGEKLRLEREDLSDKKKKLQLRRLAETYLHNP